MLLLDSDFIIAVTFPKESTYQKAQALARQYFVKENAFYLDLVMYEVATVVSRKYSHQEAIKVAAILRASKESILTLSPEDERKAWELFYSHKKKNVSFVDCANAVIADSFGLKIMSFDEFYELDLKLT